MASDPSYPKVIPSSWNQTKAFVYLYANVLKPFALDYHVDSLDSARTKRYQNTIK